MKKPLFLIFLACCLAACVKKNDATTIISLKSITFNKDTLMVNVNDSQPIAVQYSPSNYNSGSVIWSSSDTTVLTITNKGDFKAKKTGKVVVNVKTSDGSISASIVILVLIPAPPVNATQLPGKATDIGVGADGSVYITGIDSVSPTGGFSIRQLAGGNWNIIPQCAAIKVAVAPDGTPWVVNKSHLIFRHDANNLYWTQLPGTATDIGVGADGSVYITGTDSVSSTGGFSIKKWNGNDWTTIPLCAGIRIAVGPDGTPWVVNKAHFVFRYNGLGLPWTQLPDMANDIGIGADGSVYITSNTLVSASTGYVIKKWNGYGWTSLNGIAGVNISVSANGTPYWVDGSNSIFKN